MYNVFIFIEGLVEVQYSIISSMQIINKISIEIDRTRIVRPGTLSQVRLLVGSPTF